MSGAVRITIDGQPATVAPGTLVAAAIEHRGHEHRGRAPSEPGPFAHDRVASPGRGARVSPSGTRRKPFCGMGVCGECRVTIDGQAHRLGCQVLCEPGMEILTDA